MLRFALILAAAGAAAVSSGGTAWAASDITVAAIATGRLYVVGTTERPHTAVMLDDKYRTESDDSGKFQYELIYHPARCIVSAAIDGKAYQAVVTNCSQTCAVAPAGTGPAVPAAATSALPVPAPTAAKAMPAVAAPVVAAPVVRPAPAVRVGAVPVKPKPVPKPVAKPAEAAPAADRPEGVASQRTAQRPPPQARPVQPPRPARKPRPVEAPAPDAAEPPIAD